MILYSLIVELIHSPVIAADGHQDIRKQSPGI